MHGYGLFARVCVIDKGTTKKAACEGKIRVEKIEGENSTLGITCLSEGQGGQSNQNE